MVKILQLFTSEAQLVKSLQKGDTKAQRHLYEKYSARLLAVCVRYINDKMEAEDVMIEGFMRIFEKIDQFKGEGSFEGWMKRIVVTQALMTLRSNRHLMMEVNLEAEQEYSNHHYELTHLEA
ncbi:MAG: RNA polymerase sigma factor, partial [Runella zeae]